MTRLTAFARRIGLLPPQIDTTRPQIDPAVTAALDRTAVATQDLRNQLRGREAVDALLRELLGEHYLPPGAEI